GAFVHAGRRRAGRPGPLRRRRAGALGRGGARRRHQAGL
ncbi:MAG: hypothetical protein AVDCRST_MAG08-4333, partial [uncultured Acetobacteraceae bacterium]